MSNKTQYKISRASGTLKALRRKRISDSIGKKVPISTQLATVMNAVEFLFARMEELHGTDFRPDEWKEYEAMRNEVKAAVDALHAALDDAEEVQV